MSKMRWIAALLTCALACLQASASEPPAPTITEVNASSSFLQVTFSEPMLTWLGSGSSSAIVVTPPIDCSWAWTDDTLLTCHREQGAALEQATRYRLSIRGGLWSQQGREIARQDRVFDTERPSIPDAGAVIDHWEAGVPAINIWVSVPVSAMALSKALILAEDDQQVPFRLIPQTESGGIPIAEENRLWRIDYRPTDSKSHALSLRIKPGLRSSKGPLPGLQDEILLRASVNEVFGLRYVACGDGYQEGRSSSSSAVPQFRPRFVAATGDSSQEIAIACPAGQPISLGFSQPLSTDANEWLRSHLPRGLRYEAAAKGIPSRWSGKPVTELGRPAAIASLVSDAPNSLLSFDLPSSLVSAEGARILRPHRIAVTSTDFIPSLAVESPRLLLLPGSRPPPTISMVNMPALNVDIREIGGREFGSRSATLAESPRNMAVRLSPPLPLADIARHGGLVDGKLNLPSRLYYYPTSYAIAYAAFNVTTARTRDQALVWVTHWKGATAVADAKVELLRLTGPNSSSVVATAQTGDDGVAQFDLSDLGKDAARGYSLVRVTRRGQRAVMPFSSPLGKTWLDPGEPFVDVLHDGEVAQWGVSDRPLYRPGDPVRYRVWIRQRNGNHLRPLPGAGSFKLRLTRRGDTMAITTFDATLDAFGSFAGSLNLPTTIHDGDYCLSPNLAHVDDALGYSDHALGACFRVTSYHANALWAALKTDRPILLENQPVQLDAEAGYYSGGPALGARAEFRSLLSPMRLERAYPRFAGFTFIDPFQDTAGDAGESLIDAEPVLESIDRDGHAQRTLMLRAPDATRAGQEPRRRPIPFGKLDLSASVSISPSIRTVATTALSFSRYSRFVGLMVKPAVLGPDRDPELEAIVIKATGESIEHASVDVEIEERLDDDSAEETRFLAVAHCRVEAGQPTHCPFRPRHSGTYRFVARSGDAAPSLINRYAWLEGSRPAPDTESAASLTTLDPHPALGSTIDLNLRQPFAKARVLVSVEHARVLKHWTVDADSELTRIPLTIDRSWVPGVTIMAVVLDAADEAFGPRAFEGALVKIASLEIHPTGAPAPTPVVINTDRTEVRPGDRIQVHLHNPRAESVQVTLGVVDDAVRALAPALADAMNPAGDAWLGRLDRWDRPFWFGLGAWERQPGRQSGLPLSEVFVPGYQFALGEGLDTKVMSGSTPKPADLFDMAVGMERSRGRIASEVSSSAALRRTISESPFWQSDIVMKPGADRSFDIRLPDNLTRWRILAWANDDADAFTLTEATVSASLPIEVRSDGPARVFAGDRATLRASIRARRNDVHVEARLQARGAGVDAARRWNGTLAANAQQSISLVANPSEAGRIKVSAIAASDEGEHGVVAAIEVSPTLRHETLPVAGWIPAGGMRLKLPTIPAAAIDPNIRVVTSRSTAALVRTWAAGLRDDAHPYWGPMLGRAIAAAVAIRYGFADSDWPDAREVIDATLQNAGKYQDSDGNFHFLAVDDERYDRPPNLMLTTYSIQGLNFLESLGYGASADIVQSARSALAARLNDQRLVERIGVDRFVAEEVAFAASVTGAVPIGTLDALWSAHDRLSWSGRARLARILSTRLLKTTETHALVDALRHAGPRRGMSRSIGAGSDPEWPFETAMLDQCVVLDTLRDLDHADDAAGLRAEYQREFVDLYSGGEPAMDSQTRAQCLMAFANPSPAPSPTDASIHVEMSMPGASTRLEIAQGQSMATWSHALSRRPSELTAHTDADASDPISLVAEVGYDIDARASAPSAVGFQLERHYSVIREHAWKEISALGVREGEWVRVSLRLSTSRMRYFVAISDDLPGGLRAVDLELANATDLELPKGSSVGSPWFAERDVDDRHARFFSEQVPPGVHEIHYYARATHAGRYAALPAVGELMYGNASVSRTRGATITVAPAMP